MGDRREVFPATPDRVIGGRRREQHQDQRLVEAIRALIPETEVAFVRSRIMNQLSYDVANTRFQNAGFTFEDDLRTGIADTVALLGAANGRTVAGS